MSEEVRFLYHLLGPGIEPRITPKEDGSAILWDASNEEIQIIRKAVETSFPNRQVVIEMKFKICQ